MQSTAPDLCARDRNGNMGNLGAYQDIVVKAKDAGGVEMLIESIEKSAALKAMPKAFVAGIGFTAVTALGVTAIIRAYSKRSAAHEVEAVRAKAQLSTDLDEAMGSDELQIEDGTDTEKSRDDSAGPRDNP